MKVQPRHRGHHENWIQDPGTVGLSRVDYSYIGAVLNLPRNSKVQNGSESKDRCQLGGCQDPESRLGGGGRVSISREHKMQDQNQRKEMKKRVVEVPNLGRSFE